MRKRMETRWEANPAVARACAGFAVDSGIPALRSASHTNGTLLPARPAQESSP